MTEHYTAKPFMSGNSQAVRIPKAMAFPQDIVLEFVPLGDGILVRPKTDRFDAMFAALRALPGPGEIEVRDTEEIPEPKGL